MKNLSIIFIFLLFSSVGFSQDKVKTFHNFKEMTILGDSIDFSVFSGKKLLVVNTASYCGYTFEFKDLEKLYLQYGGPNFTIVGFPSNDFGAQDPYNDSTINAFCQDNYSVTFPMMSKVHTITGDTADVYKWLQRKNLNGVANASVIWNFNKFLVDEQGHWVAYFPQTTLPYDTAIVNWINKPSIYTGISGSVSSAVHLTSANPVHDQLSFNLNNSTIQKVLVKLFTLNGIEAGVVYDGNLTGNQSVNYNTSSLASGVYLMQVQSPAFCQTVKVVVAH